MNERQIVELNIKDLVLLEKNPRKIRSDQMQKLEKSLQDDPDFLWKRPVLVNHSSNIYTVYAGNQRVRAAKKLKWKTIPCIVDIDLSEEIIQSRIAKDNLHSGEWDFEVLANELDLDLLINSGFTESQLIGKVDKAQKEKNSRAKKCPECGCEF